MSIFPTTTESNFCLEGRFIDFVIKDGYKLKGLYIETPDGELYVKLAKHLRVAFDWRLPAGTWLKVVGEKKLDPKTGNIKLKAERVMAASGEQDHYKVAPAQVTSLQPPTEPSTTQAKCKPATILMCQKSDCMKRGGTGVCKALEAQLSERGLQNQVTIKATGCMKNCKGGPNLVMPDKTRYSRISASEVAAILDKHFAAPKPKATPIVSFSESSDRMAV